jgi:hypothetical protein
LGYFLSLGLKKNHSFSPNKAFPAQVNRTTMSAENNASRYLKQKQETFPFFVLKNKKARKSLSFITS